MELGRCITNTRGCCCDLGQQQCWQRLQLLPLHVCMTDLWRAAAAGAVVVVLSCLRAERVVTNCQTSQSQDGVLCVSCMHNDVCRQLTSAPAFDCCVLCLLCVCVGLGEFQAGVDAAAPVLQVQRVQQHLCSQPTQGACWQGERQQQQQRRLIPAGTRLSRGMCK